VELFRMRRQVARQAELQVRREAAEEAARRSAFLAEASRALASSLDVDTTLRALVQLAVPALADLGFACLSDARANPDRAEWAWVDPVLDSLVQPPGHGLPSYPRLAEAVTRVLATGSPVELKRGDELLAPGPEAGLGEDSAAGPDFPLSSAVVLPLVAR